ncbi:MAG: hypothetical protein J7604_00545 [Sporocytophaga sp.]|uniref:hypothetical protein n=1 Tax=Sporocytophaga sp. TaxID=2231183 RepID=UPI001B2B8A5B|nr:hypothetical protein [Sporocytophaga sp.]MBO9698658.1 hypothetical protein [Sporocytophaga sp.]
MKRNQILIILLTIVSSLYSCKDKDPIPGPQGPAGKDINMYPYTKDGSVKGKLYSTGKDGKDTLLGEFNYQYIFESNASLYERGRNPNVTIIRRDSVKGGNIFILSSYIDIMTDTIKPGIMPGMTNIYFGYVKDLGNGKYLRFGETSRPHNNVRTDVSPWTESSFSISNYSFDKNSRNLKFDFEILYVGNETLSGKNSKVIGSVDVTLKEIVTLRSGNVNN